MYPTELTAAFLPLLDRSRLVVDPAVGYESFLRFEFGRTDVVRGRFA
ncbi:MAG: hypothetical protein WEB58_20090 [Planctomycetaceae bacterium]